MPDEGRFVPGTLLAGRYRIIGLLGRGGMGEVYRATDLTLGQSVALKFLPAFDERMLERFHSEVRIARQVSHPNVCRVYDIGQAEGMPFLSMEYVDGEDLSSLLHRIGRLPNDKAIELTRKICAGLAAAHDKGVMHRDLKPQNIMLNKRGEVLIMDFGLAAAADQLHGAEAKSGTPAYMAPEQLKGSEVTHKSDLYALGLVMYELFTGKKPYEAKSIGELIALQEAVQVTSMTTVAADIDPEVEKVIRRCLDPNPSSRPASALSVAAQLPGGDPLAAALAAGETPSPELVAAAKSQGLRLRYSAPMLGFILVGLIAFPWLKEVSEAIAMAPFELPPDALEAKAQQVAADFGYNGRPADTWRLLLFRGGLIEYLRGAQNGNKDWRKLFAAESPILFYYRQSPEFFATNAQAGMSWDLPPNTEQGMVKVALDSRGNLRQFQGVPPAFHPLAEAQAPASELDPKQVFKAAGLEFERFAEVVPQYAPPAASDRHKAFRGPHPSLANVPITVEYASWRGRLTHLQVVWPYTKPPAAGRRGAENLLSQISRSLGYVLLAALCFWVLVLARRNWTKGRADRRGALRLAAAMFALKAFAWFMGAHIRPTQGILSAFFNACGDWLFAGATCWMIYLALEPFLRARWPQSIITWNRLLAGKVADEQVGTHMLVGIALGIFLGWVLFFRSYWTGANQLGLSTTNLYPLLGVRNWLEILTEQLTSAIWFGLLLCFLLFGLRRLVRWDWLVALIAAVLMTLVFEQLDQSKTVWLDAGIKISAYLILAYAVSRFGLISAVMLIFSVNALGGANISADLTTWYAPYGIVTVLLIAGLAIFGFWRSMGDQEFAAGA